MDSDNPDDYAGVGVIIIRYSNENGVFPYIKFSLTKIGMYDDEYIEFDEYELENILKDFPDIYDSLIYNYNNFIKNIKKFIDIMLTIIFNVR